MSSKKSITEDMYGMAGVSKEEDLNTPVGESVRLRLPWLVINLLTAFIAAFVVREFEGTIAKVVALSATMSNHNGNGRKRRDSDAFHHDKEHSAR
jgi:magnesium transporter